MPYLKIQTGLTLDSAAQKKILARASARVAGELGKPEGYVMVAFAHAPSMMFAGTDAPCAYLELKSIGLPKNKTAAISKSLCQLVSEEMHIPAERVYIEFANAEGPMWGWDGGTF
jgi:phenylpyruvate tautomerase PptA (4-oxalocrotonate tautomerase family)